MANQRYYHLTMKPMEVIRPEPLRFTLAARRILDLDDLEMKRSVANPALLTAVTARELEQFKMDDQVVAQRALVFADNASLVPDGEDSVAYFCFYHHQDMVVDPPTHAVAIVAQDRHTDGDIPVVPIHLERFTPMLKSFPRLPANPHRADTTKIAKRHPNYLNAKMRTEGDIPMVNLDVTSVKAFIAVRHWVYTQDQGALANALLGEPLAASLDHSVFAIEEPAYCSPEFFKECLETAGLSVRADSLEASALTQAEASITELQDLAVQWELVSDGFWAVVFTLERMLLVAQKIRGTPGASQ